MALDRYQLVLLALGIPVTLWIVFVDRSRTSADLRLAVSLVWFGFGMTVILFSRARKQQQS